jgi:hypothetical protein
MPHQHSRLLGSKESLLTAGHPPPMQLPPAAAAGAAAASKPPTPTTHPNCLPACQARRGGSDALHQESHRSNSIHDKSTVCSYG